MSPNGSLCRTNASTFAAQQELVGLEVMVELFRMRGEPREQIVSGLQMIGVNAISYAILHVFFFGVPHFTFRTGQGIAEIGFTTCTFALVGMAVCAVYCGVRSRRTQS